jgi:hypothetical protein
MDHLKKKILQDLKTNLMSDVISKIYRSAKDRESERTAIELLEFIRGLVLSGRIHVFLRDKR